MTTEYYHGCIPEIEDNGQGIHHVTYDGIKSSAKTFTADGTVERIGWVTFQRTTAQLEDFMTEENPSWVTLTISDDFSEGETVAGEFHPADGTNPEPITIHSIELADETTQKSLDDIYFN